MGEGLRNLAGGGVRRAVRVGVYLLGGIGAILAVPMTLIEAGWWLGNWRRQRSKEEKDAPIGSAVGATLGLLAFLLAFTFGMAASRFDNRKQIVLQEANAIGTTYLRVDFLPDRRAREARNLLREYTALRAGVKASIMSPEGMARPSAIHDQLWAIANTAPRLRYGRHRAVHPEPERDDRPRCDPGDGQCATASRIAIWFMLCCRDHLFDDRHRIPVRPDRRRVAGPLRSCWCWFLLLSSC